MRAIVRLNMTKNLSSYVDTLIETVIKKIMLKDKSQKEMPNKSEQI